MNDNETIFQKYDTIATTGLRAILSDFMVNTQRDSQNGDMDPCHKSVATMTSLFKLIKDIETYNETLLPKDKKIADNIRPADELDPEELRARLTRYLARLDASAMPTIVIHPDE
ncbi:hypothetical protein [Fretibacter rubidus]|uniref:hypothetical protein n=1 Tax=Fretibacter rubidus TaxID=570162 RepID=UPI00352AD80C